MIFSFNRTREPGIVDDAAYGFHSQIDKIDLLFLTNSLKLFQLEEAEKSQKPQPKWFQNLPDKTMKIFTSHNVSRSNNYS